jgi:mRNA interferase MazF
VAGLTRGDVYRVRLPAARGREQRGARYGVLVQADELLGLSTVLVAPTSRSVRPATFRPEVEVAGERTRVMVEQLRALDVQRLDEFAGRLSASEMRDLDEALTLILALR